MIRAASLFEELQHKIGKGHLTVAQALIDAFEAGKATRFGTDFETRDAAVNRIAYKRGRIKQAAFDSDDADVLCGDVRAAIRDGYDAGVRDSAAVAAAAMLAAKQTRDEQFALGQREAIMQMHRDFVDWAADHGITIREQVTCDKAMPSCGAGFAVHKAVTTPLEWEVSDDRGVQGFGKTGEEAYANFMKAAARRAEEDAYEPHAELVASFDDEVES